MLHIPFVLHKACTDQLLDSSLRFCEPYSQGYNTFYTCIDKFTKFVHLIPCFKGEGAPNIPECTNLFFLNIVRLFGVPKMVLHDHDSRFTSKFWRALWEYLCTKVLLTSAYHP